MGRVTLADMHDRVRHLDSLPPGPEPLSIEEAAYEKPGPNWKPDGWTMWTNVSITRRKSFHLVENPLGEIEFRDRHFWPCVEYLNKSGIAAYTLRPSEGPQGGKVPKLLIRRKAR